MSLPELPRWTSPVVSIADAKGPALEFIASVTLDEATATALSTGPNSARPLICLIGTAKSDGFYIVSAVTTTGGESKISCLPSADNDIWQNTHGIVQEDGDNNNFYVSKDPPKALQNGTAGMVFIPGPLLFHCRASIFGVDQVDTVNQTFQAEFYTELRLRGLLEQSSEQIGHALMAAYGLSATEIVYMNVSEVVGEKEMWFGMAEGILKNRHVFCIKMRQKICFNELMELENFPFDIQELNIPLSFNASVRRTQLALNMQYQSLFFHKQFQLSSVYNVVYKDLIPAEVSMSDPRESSAGIVYPRCTFKVLLERKSGYYISNVVVPLSLLTILGPLSNAVELDGSSMGTGDRLSVTLTLILTAVAYKFVVAASLPQVSYLTLLDVHVLVCFAFLVANAIENVLYPILVYEYDATDSVEKIFVYIYYIVFALFHIIYFGVIAWKMNSRNEFFKTDMLYENTRRAVQTVLFHQKGETRYGAGEEVLSRVLQQKGMALTPEQRARGRSQALRIVSFNPFGRWRGAPVRGEGDSEQLVPPEDLDLIDKAYQSVKLKTV